MFLSLKRNKSKDLYRESLALWSRQISETIKKHRWSNVSNLKRPIKNIVINGMGGSNLGAEIIVSLLKKEMKIPVLIEAGYEVPGYVDKDTAYIVSSYSGTTEEPLAAYKKAKTRGALVIALSSLGESDLSKIAQRDSIPLFQFPTTSNLSGQPRLGLGAALTSCALILCELKAVKKNVIKELELAAKKYSRTTKIIETSKHFARRLKNRELVLISGPLFVGNLKTLRNQVCESAKNFGQYLTISDMNHFALEGLKFPKSNKKRLAAVFFDSKLDNPKIQKRMELTKEVFRKNKIPVLSYEISGKTIIEQGIELLQFSNYLSYYISINNHVDPMRIPSVDWFKKKLSN